MAFQEDFSAFLSRSGITLAAGTAPSRDGLAEGLRKLSAFINSLDSVTAAALEEVTTDFPVKALLADPTVNVAPELGPVLRAFDQANASISISGLAEICRKPLDLPPPPPTPGVPNISSIEPHQATLHNNEGNIVVRWSTRDQCDKYHFMWTDSFPPPQSARGWAEVELNVPGSFGFSFRIPRTSIGRTYTFKVQGCKAFDLGPDKCSNFSPDSAIVMPKNTHSLREFLRLSNVQLNPGIRSLGAPAFSAGIRAMMRL